MAAAAAFAIAGAWKRLPAQGAAALLACANAGVCLVDLLIEGGHVVEPRYVVVGGPGLARFRLQCRGAGDGEAEIGQVGAQQLQIDICVVVIQPVVDKTDAAAHTAPTCLTSTKLATSADSRAARHA